VVCIGRNISSHLGVEIAAESPASTKLKQAAASLKAGSF
jgi:hypothetical protein